MGRARGEPRARAGHPLDRRARRGRGARRPGHGLLVHPDPRPEDPGRDRADAERRLAGRERPGRPAGDEPAVHPVVPRRARAGQRPGGLVRPGAPARRLGLDLPRPVPPSRRAGTSPAAPKAESVPWISGCRAWTTLDRVGRRGPRSRTLEVRSLRSSRPPCQPRPSGDERSRASNRQNSDMTDLDYGAFDALTFDCYGTLIDWESGILAGLRAMLAAHGADASDDEAARGFAAAEARLEAGQYLPYRTILASAGRTVAKDLGVAITDDEAVAFGDSVGAWPAFDDSHAVAEDPAAPVPARRADELRRRALRGIEPPARGRVRLGPDGTAARGVQARTRTTSRRSASASTTTGSPPGGSSTSPRACTTTTSRRRGSASTRSGSTAATTGPAAGRPRPRMSTRTRRSRRWPPSPRPPFPGDGVDGPSDGRADRARGRRLAPDGSAGGPTRRPAVRAPGSAAVDAVVRERAPPQARR